LNDLQFSELSDELDVAEHLALGQVLGVLLVAGDRRHRQLLVLVAELVSAKQNKFNSVLTFVTAENALMRGEKFIVTIKHNQICFNYNRNRKSLYTLKILYENALRTSKPFTELIIRACKFIKANFVDF